MRQRTDRSEMRIGAGLIGRYVGEIAERARTIDAHNLPLLMRQI